MYNYAAKAMWGGIAVCLAMLTVVACTPAKAMMGFKNEVVRYRVTVEIETPEGIKTGSAVREAGAYTEPSILPDQGGTSYNITKGEAVVIDLGQRGVVFALLGGGAEARLVSRALRLEGKLSFQLKPSEYPQFVYFKDMTDPKTVAPLLLFGACPDERGIPHNLRCIKNDMFAQTFGDGVKLATIKVENTNKEVTVGLEKILAWLPSYYDKQLDGSKFSSANAKLKFANKLTSGAFSTELSPYEG